MDLQYFHDQGERDENLDLFFCFSKESYLFLVMADGYEKSSETELRDYLQKICHEVINKHQEHTLSSILENVPPEKTRTSMLISKISENELEVCSVGDCRAYVNNKLITADDSLAWKNLSKRKPPEDVVRLVATHPLRHNLIDSMTPDRKKHIPTSRESLNHGDYLVFCTDGVWPFFHKDICSGSFKVKDIDIKTEDNSLVVSITV